jgi:hypothetical protein
MFLCSRLVFLFLFLVKGNERIEGRLEASVVTFNKLFLIKF